MESHSLSELTVDQLQISRTKNLRLRFDYSLAEKLEKNRLTGSWHTEIIKLCTCIVLNS